jgi:hypothetical protein
MTKKENISYQRKVSDITDGLMVDAYRSAIDEVDRIHRDILLSLRGKIDAWLAEHPKVEGTYHPKK